MKDLGLWFSKQGVKSGEWYGEAVAFAKRAALSSDLSADALRVLVLLRLYTVRYHSEKAVTMRNGQRQRITPNEVVKGTRLSRQNVRRALVELEDAGYVERRPIGKGGLRKGNVQIWCWTVPREPKTPRPVNNVDYGLPLLVLKLVRRFHILLPPDFIATPDYKARVAAAAEDYKRAEMVAASVFKKAFFVGPDAPRLSEGTVRGSVRTQGGAPPPDFSQAPSSAGRSDAGQSDTPTGRPDDDGDNPFKTAIRDWLEATFALPFPLEDPELSQIAATIQNEQHFEQFMQAAKAVKKPRGWKVFVTVARTCQRRQASYAKAMAAAAEAGGQESYAQQRYREIIEERSAQEAGRG